MLKIIGTSDSSFSVVDTDDGAVDVVSAEELVLALSVGVAIEGCRYSPNGLYISINGGQEFEVCVEVWKKVVPYNIQNPDGTWRYEVSNLGRVRSHGSVNSCFGPDAYHILATVVSSQGYHLVYPSVGGVRVGKGVHRFVALAFVPNPNNADTVNHKDEDKSNNSAYNLEWLTVAENVRYGSGIKRRALSVTRRIRQYAISGELLNEFSSINEIADKFGFSATDIAHCCARYPNNRTAHGYSWRYVSDDELFPLSEYERRYIISDKYVRQYTKDGSFVAEYPKATDAAKALGLPASSIYMCCRRAPKFKSCGGFIWRYAVDDEFDLS